MSGSSSNSHNLSSPDREETQLREDVKFEILNGIDRMRKDSPPEYEISQLYNLIEGFHDDGQITRLQFNFFKECLSSLLKSSINIEELKTYIKKI